MRGRGLEPPRLLDTRTSSVPVYHFSIPADKTNALYQTASFLGYTTLNQDRCMHFKVKNWRQHEQGYKMAIP